MLLPDNLLHQVIAIATTTFKAKSTQPGIKRTALNSTICPAPKAVNGTLNLPSTTDGTMHMKKNQPTSTTTTATTTKTAPKTATTKTATSATPMNASTNMSPTLVCPRHTTAEPKKQCTAVSNSEARHKEQKQEQKKNQNKDKEEKNQNTMSLHPVQDKMIDSLNLGVILDTELRIDEITDLKRYHDNSLSAATRKAYLSDCQSFSEFIVSRFPLLPLEQIKAHCTLEHVLAYLNHYAMRVRKSVPSIVVCPR